MSTRESQFYCPACQATRQGDRNDFVHCFQCETCISKRPTVHKCMTPDVCAVCREDVVKCTENVRSPSCGHKVHERCINEWIGRGQTTCPTCRAELAIMPKPVAPRPTERSRFFIKIIAVSVVLLAGAGVYYLNDQHHRCSRIAAQQRAVITMLLEHTRAYSIPLSPALRLRLGELGFSEQLAALECDVGR